LDARQPAVTPLLLPLPPLLLLGPCPAASEDDAEEVWLGGGGRG
jgi:hypothetical protein